MKDCAPRFPLLAPLVLTAVGLFGVAIATIQIVFVARDLERVGVVTVRRPDDPHLTQLARFLRTIARHGRS